MQPLIYHFKTNPFFKLLIAFAIGIILENSCGFPVTIIFSCFGIVLIFFSVTRMSSFGRRFKLKWFTGLLLLVLITLSGSIITLLHDVRNAGNSIQDISAVKELYVELNESPIEKPNSLKAEATIIAKKVSTWSPGVGKMIIYFEKYSSKFQNLKAGDCLKLFGPVTEIKNSGNPGSFDYKTYCQRQGILYQAFIQEGNANVTGKNNANAFSKFLSSVQTHIISCIQQNVPDKNSAAIAEALLIGYKTDLDKDLMQAYSNTGVIHIIAISGLHLALIYSLLLKIVSAIPYCKNKKGSKAFVIVFLWFFSILTGASASVLRAAVMFSFLIIGDLLDKRQRSLNTLAASAFLLLLYDPYFLWDAGFQLSYAAVASIMIFYKNIYNIFFVKNKLLDSFWKLNAVTLSAQILTLPFVIFHFHQFPNLFLFTNIAAVPLSGLILYAEIFLLVLSPIAKAAEIIGIMVSMLIQFMNVFISYMNSFRFSVLTGISFNLFSAVSLILFIACISFYFQTAVKKHLFVALLFLLVIITMQSVQSLTRKKNSKLIVYNIPKVPAAEIISGKQCFFFGNTKAITNPTTFNFNILPAHNKFGIENRIQATNFHRMTVGNKKIIFGGQPVKDAVYIITDNLPMQSLNLSANRPAIVIADNTNAKWKIKQWKKQADSLHLRFHSVPDDGAFVMDL